MNRTYLAGIAVAATLALAQTASAHHSIAMFDFSKTLRISGTVKDFEWTNPHTWTNVKVDGVGSVYGLEGMSPNYLSRNGWTKRTLKPGDRVQFEIHPLKDGRKGGFMVSAKLADGTLLYNLPKRPE
ncbi:MAG: hypothetical protein RLZZ200_2054 [Pseudomonadota bacterium]|jgi:hypothetical protein